MLRPSMVHPLHVCDNHVTLAASASHVTRPRYVGGIRIARDATTSHLRPGMTVIPPSLSPCSSFDQLYLSRMIHIVTRNPVHHRFDGHLPRTTRRLPSQVPVTQ